MPKIEFFVTIGIEKKLRKIAKNGFVGSRGYVKVNNLQIGILFYDENKK